MKLILRTMLAALILSGMPSLAHAQDSERPAKIDKQTHVVTLDESVPFGYIYHMDISAMDFPSKEKAKEFFRPFNTELVSFNVHFDEKKVNIVLDVRSQPTWGAADWNKYFAGLTPKK